MMKRCFSFPHCACGLQIANRLADEGQKMLIFRNRDATIRRVPVSELLSFAIVEEVDPEQYSLGCPKFEEDVESGKALADELGDDPRQQEL